MKENLLRSREYWMVQIQNNLFSVLEEYMTKNELNRTDLANKLKVTKGYVSQILNGDFDHKVSKLVDLSLFAGKVPILNFVSIDKYIEDDAKNHIYDLFSMPRPKMLTFSIPSSIEDIPKNKTEKEYGFEKSTYSEPVTVQD